MNHTIKKVAKGLAHFLWKMGFDPKQIALLRYYPKYYKQYRQFERLGGVVTHRYPIFSDYGGEAGSARGHYFHQDLLVASFIWNNNPSRHIDIGSRVDGFVAHVAAFRRIDVMDVRDLRSTGHNNISFIKADLTNSENAQSNITDSISCLHAIEHFGLGRYGDTVDPQGHIKGFNNLIRMLKCDGKLFISFPIGRENEVRFNAHRVFHPSDIFTWADDSSILKLERFDYVDDAGSLHQNVELGATRLDVTYGCGIYTFRKTR